MDTKPEIVIPKYATMLAAIKLVVSCFLIPVLSFSTIEHREIGDGRTLRYVEGGKQENLLAKTAKLELPNGNALSFGEIIALAGDFYGVPSLPISEGTTSADRASRFKKAFYTLAYDADTPIAVDKDYPESKNLKYLSQVLMAGPMKTMEAALDQAKKSGQSPSEAWRITNKHYAMEMRYNKLTGGTAVTFGRYMKLAASNFDHFNGVSHAAYLSYSAGHIEAMRTAQQAKQAGSNKKMLMLAYAKEAYAQHYLTDMFAAGHMRVPRNELQAFCAVGLQGGALTKLMHGEDNEVGLLVTNEKGKLWRAYGDENYFSVENKDNRQVTEECSQTSIDEVFNAFQTGTFNEDPKNFAANKCLPKVVPAGKGGNHYPLYSVKSTVVPRKVKGSCKKSVPWYRFSCDIDRECRSSTTDPCTGYCRCDTKGINECTCVKDHEDVLVLRRKDKNDIWDSHSEPLESCTRQFVSHIFFDKGTDPDDVDDDDEYESEEEPQKYKGHIPAKTYGRLRHLDRQDSFRKLRSSIGSSNRRG